MPLNHAIEGLFPENVRAFMSTRQGGRSPMPWDSLNLGLRVGDCAVRVHENRQRLLMDCGASPEWPCSWMHQVHGTAVLGPDLSLVCDQSRADASWTHLPRQICLVQVADCLPVLLAMADGSAVAACHAGWRGLHEGVIEATVKAMPKGEKIAWLGPAIGPSAFEVGAEVRDAFTRLDPAAEPGFQPHSILPDKYLADLVFLARQRLEKLAVNPVYALQECTYHLGERYFSYRRDGVTGRMAALIWRE